MAVKKGDRYLVPEVETLCSLMKLCSSKNTCNSFRVFKLHVKSEHKARDESISQSLNCSSNSTLIHNHTDLY